ncbi:Biotin carboxyl carrier protein of acetyl-CoA carboxylase 1 [Hibiscus syriacus]|uniref:Biotin carboxyl carrier protein of acetyl-CoA carboxylase n=1 Tax=Hibiscus syriacus TaxID=106335 RepID=A0A6A3BCP4_HIBSY|nr:biotin carboxyl carrier protein of acetyl-CoA carboxylase 1, chloroplastic-like [Hibiscus syriacus]KAE8714664.1 Biotin carboxyl carrier protein of acetyl-CoA carboxylase 1 [Hibiscus syriacus]
MASALSTTASIAKTTTTLPHSSNLQRSNLSFRLSFDPNFQLFPKSSLPRRNSSTVVKAQLNEVALDGSSNASTTPTVKSGAPKAEAKNAKQSSDVSPSTLATEESVSEFLNQVSSLVKLVDSRDIVELQLKQLDCELVIRKKEALPQPPSAAPVVMMQSPSQPPVMPPIPSVSAPSPSAQASTASTPAPLPTAPRSVKSSLPPLKCPMAGTFYRSPAPGEPPFVKVGDKVQKGQVLCIIEAMKLMNEIEADQSGTIVEIPAEDGKPVSVDMPLFVIEP